MSYFWVNLNADFLYGSALVCKIWSIVENSLLYHNYFVFICCFTIYTITIKYCIWNIFVHWFCYLCWLFVCFCSSDSLFYLLWHFFLVTILVNLLYYTINVICSLTYSVYFSLLCYLIMFRNLKLVVLNFGQSSLPWPDTNAHHLTWDQ